MDQGSHESLIWTLHELVHQELKLADEVVSAKVFLSLLIIIVTIIDLNLEELFLFELIDSCDLRDKMGELGVVDCLCFSKFAPFSVNHLEEDSKWVRLRAILMSNQVGQVLAANAQREFRGQEIGSTRLRNSILPGDR